MQNVRPIPMVLPNYPLRVSAHPYSEFTIELYVLVEEPAVKKEITVVLPFTIDDAGGIGHELTRWHYVLYRDDEEMESGSVLNLKPINIREIK